MREPNPAARFDALMQRLRYRPEVDGLRALAVLAVVLYHTNLLFSGGYVGVDIFFVISGYLITGLIASDLAAGTFTLKEFWIRRIRRIMPAAAVTVLVSLAVGYWLLLPAHVVELGQSAVAQAAMAANVYFYHQADYFATAAQSKPLLHFWSLAVEEQFYLIFPLLLLAVRSWSRRAVIGGVAALAVASFVASVIGTEAFPMATFYLLPTRAWELALGALLALAGGRLPGPARFHQPLGWLGVALLIAPMIAYDHGTSFPGLAALPPCLGAVLVIGATVEGRGLLYRALAFKPLVAIGLISYSLYLWHWPVMVYSHYWLTQIYSPFGLRVIVVVTSLLLAWLSWKYVEQPFRVARRPSPRRWRVATALAGTAAAAVAGVVFARHEGWPARFPPEVVNYGAAYYDHPEIEEADLSIEDAQAGQMTLLKQAPAGRADTILLWGDSHARVASTAIEAMCEQVGVTGYRASRSGTAGLLQYGDEPAQAYNEAVFRWIELHRPTWVVLASRWEVVLTGPDDEACLRETVARIQALGVNVSIMRQVAAQRRDIPRVLAKTVMDHGNVAQVGVLVEDHRKFTQQSNHVIDAVVALTPGVRVLDPIPYLSTNERCLAEEAGRALYYDNQHLTRAGAAHLTPMFVTLFAQ